MASAVLALVRDFALPPTCVACRAPVAEDGGMCAACWRRITFIERPFCVRLGIPFQTDLGPGVLSPAAIAAPPAFHRARAVARYDDVGRALVTALKFGDRLDIAAPLGRLMARAGADLLADADALVPVPLHWTRLLRRRFNQAAALADVVSRSSAVPVRNDLLVRCRRTAHQIGLDRTARARNVQGAFMVPLDAIGEVRGRSLVLVDDVLTTGATLEACARALSRAGAARVDVLVFARVVDSAGGA